MNDIDHYRIYLVTELEHASISKSNCSCFTVSKLLKIVTSHCHRTVRNIYAFIFDYSKLIANARNMQIIRLSTNRFDKVKLNIQ